MRMVKALSLCLALAIGVAVGTPSAKSQDAYPSKSVKIIVPYAPGASVDVIARTVADQLRQSLGQQFVIDNKPGAFGVVAIEELARAKPDGYTLFVGNVSTNGLAPLVHRKRFSIDYQKSVIPVARIADIPSLLIATKANFPPKTFAELIAYAKQNPGKVRYATPGPGSFTHFDTEILAKRAGLDLVHIPFKTGAAAMIADMVNGDAQIAFMNLSTMGPMIRAGKLQVYAAATEQRLPEVPDVPTMAELGFPGIGSQHWLAMFAPTGTPDAILDKLHAAIVQGVNTPTVQESFKKGTIRAVPTASRQDAADWYAKEMASWARIIDEAKIDLSD